MDPQPITVWIVQGLIEYEGSEILTVCENEAIARMFEQEWINKIKHQQTSYDDVEVQEYPLITGVNLVLGVQEISV